MAMVAMMVATMEVLVSFGMITVMVMVTVLNEDAGGDAVCIVCSTDDDGGDDAMQDITG